VLSGKIRLEQELPYRKRHIAKKYKPTCGNHRDHSMVPFTEVLSAFRTISGISEIYFARKILSIGLMQRGLAPFCRSAL
jgi:hypothetical protein